MTRIVRPLARRLWNLALPARQAAVGRIDRLLDRHMQLWFERTEPARARQQQAGEDMMLVADALVRELARLQSQVAALEEAIARLESAERAPGLRRGAA